MHRKYLTSKQRTSIQAEIRKGMSIKAFRYDELAAWARVQLKLPFYPSLSALSRLSTALFETRDIPKNDAKNSKHPAQATLEHQLLQWINTQNNSERCLTSDVIRTKAMRILEEINDLLPQGSQNTFKFPSGWLWRF